MQLVQTITDNTILSSNANYPDEYAVSKVSITETNPGEEAVSKLDITANHPDEDAVSKVSITETNSVEEVVSQVSDTETDPYEKAVSDLQKICRSAKGLFLDSLSQIGEKALTCLEEAARKYGSFDKGEKEFNQLKRKKHFGDLAQLNLALKYRGTIVNWSPEMQQLFKELFVEWGAGEKFLKVALDIPEKTLGVILKRKRKKPVTVKELEAIRKKINPKTYPLGEYQNRFYNNLAIEKLGISEEQFAEIYKKAEEIAQKRAADGLKKVAKGKKIPDKLLSPKVLTDDVIESLRFWNFPQTQINKLLPSSKPLVDNSEVMTRNQAQKIIDEQVNEFKAECQSNHERLLYETFEAIAANTPENIPEDYLQILLKQQESQQQRNEEIEALQAQLEVKQQQISELTKQKVELVEVSSSYEQQLEAKEQELQAKGQELQVKEQELQVKEQELKAKEQQLHQITAINTPKLLAPASSEQESPNHLELDNVQSHTDEDKQPELSTSDIDAPIIVVERSESSKVTDSSNNDVSSHRQPVVLDVAQAEGQTATLSDKAEPITCDINKGLESTNSFNVKLGVACEEEQDKPEVVADKSDSKEQGDRNIEELVDNKSKKSNSKKKKKNGFGQESYQQPKKHSHKKLATSGAVA